MAEGDTPGLQWERTRLSWIRTLASAATLEAAIVGALVHAKSRSLLLLLVLPLAVASTAILFAQRDLTRTHTPGHPTAYRTLKSLVGAMSVLAVAGTVIALTGYP